jgi:hypothetical protein
VASGGNLTGLTSSCSASWRGPIVTASGILQPDSDEAEALQALTRAHEDLVGARVALANQLRAELERFWPGPVGLFCDLDRPISLAFLARYPSPWDARGLGEKRLAAFLKAHRYNNRKTPAQLLERLRSAPADRAGEIETRARRSIVAGAGRHAVGHRRSDRRPGAHDRRGAGRPPRRRDLPQLLSLAELGDLRRTLLSEIGDCRAPRYPHRDAIAADSGHAPVAVESGKRKNAAFRWACNKRLRSALATLAQSTQRWNPWAADRYASAATTTPCAAQPSVAP